MADPQSARWLTSILPIATLILGYATKSVSDWLDFRRTREREREARREIRRDQLFERRNAFQREILLELQDKVMDFVRTTMQINQKEILASRGAGHWVKRSLPDELSEESRLDNAKTTVLAVRVRDKTVRDLVGELKQHTMALVFAQNEQASMLALPLVTGVFDRLNARIGELLREMDDEVS